MVDLKNMTYWVVHLENGTMLYSKDEVRPDLTETGFATLIGLDENEYHYLPSKVTLIHKSTPEARNFFTELKMSIQEEAANLQHKRIAELMKKEQETDEKIGSAIDAVRRVQPRLAD